MCVVATATVMLRPLRLLAEATRPIEYNKAVYSLPITFDPVQMNDTGSLLFSELVYEGLLHLTNDYGYDAALAESWSVTPDGKKLTFKIRKNAKFHSGEPVEAADAVASLTRAVAPQSKVFSYCNCIEGASSFHDQKAKAVSGLRVIDKSALEITLTKPFPPFMYVLAGATAKILPRRALTQKDFFKSPIGSGPFQFTKVTEEPGAKKLTLARFIGAPRSKGNIDRLSLIETDEATAQKLAAQGMIDDLGNWPLNGNEDVFSKGQKVSSPVAGTWVIGLNSRLAPFENAQTRRSFKSAFDTDKFRQQFYPDAEKAFGYIPPGFPGHIGTALPQAATAAASKSEITIAIPDGLANGTAIAKFIADDFKSRGWNVKTQIMPWADLMKRYEDKSLQAFLVSMNVDYPDSEFLLRNFESTNPDNFSGMRDPKLDQILARARSTVDRVTREALYKDAAARVEDFAATINLFYPRAHAWISKCVKGFEPNLLSDVYIDYGRVSIDSACVGERTSP